MDRPPQRVTLHTTLAIAYGAFAPLVRIVCVEGLASWLVKSYLSVLVLCVGLRWDACLRPDWSLAAESEAPLKLLHNKGSDSPMVLCKCG